MSMQTTQTIKIKAPTQIAARVYSGAGRPLSVDYKRDNKVMIRLNDYEYEALKNTWRQSLEKAQTGCSLAEFCRSIVNSYAGSTLYENCIQELVNHKLKIRNTGIKINEIAHAFNAEFLKVSDADALKDLVKELRIVRNFVNILPKNLVRHDPVFDAIDENEEAKYKRKNLILLRFNEHEIEKISRAWEANKKNSLLKFSVQNFIRAVLSNSTPEIFQRQTTLELNSISYQLSAIANNLNQIRLKVIHQADPARLKENLVKILNEIVQMLFNASASIDKRILN